MGVESDCEIAGHVSVKPLRRDGSIEFANDGCQERVLLIEIELGTCDLAETAYNIGKPGGCIRGR